MRWGRNSQLNYWLTLLLNWRHRLRLPKAWVSPWDTPYLFLFSLLNPVHCTNTHYTYGFEWELCKTDHIKLRPIKPLRARKNQTHPKSALQAHKRDCVQQNTKVISVFTAFTKASVLFFGSSLRGKEFRRSCVGELRSEAAGTSPDVKPAPQWNGFPGESKVKLSWDQGTAGLKNSVTIIMCFKSFKLIFSSCTNSTAGMSYKCCNLHWNTNK